MLFHVYHRQSHLFKGSDAEAVGWFEIKRSPLDAISGEVFPRSGRPTHT
jgi:hypothetical protein